MQTFSLSEKAALLLTPKFLLTELYQLEYCDYKGLSTPAQLA